MKYVKITLYFYKNVDITYRVEQHFLSTYHLLTGLKLQYYGTKE